MQRTPIDEIVFCHTHKHFHLSHVTVAVQIAVTRADFIRTSVTVPRVMRQCNSIPTKFLLSGRKVLTSKNWLHDIDMRPAVYWQALVLNGLLSL